MDISPTRRTLVARVRPPSVRPLHLLHFNFPTQVESPTPWKGKLWWILKPGINFYPRITQLLFHSYFIHNIYMEAPFFSLNVTAFSQRYRFFFFNAWKYFVSLTQGPAMTRSFWPHCDAYLHACIQVLCLECHPSRPALCCYCGSEPFSSQYSGLCGVIHNMCYSLDQVFPIISLYLTGHTRMRLFLAQRMFHDSNDRSVQCRPLVSLLTLTWITRKQVDPQRQLTLIESRKRLKVCEKAKKVCKLTSQLSEI
jgi:hypothetical protein